MTVSYYDATRGLVRELRSGEVSVPFGEGLGPSLYFKKEGRTVPIESGGSVEGVRCSLRLEVTLRALLVHVTLENLTDRDFAPEALGLRLGVDSYMVDYPSWNDKYFPTMLRCEKTHFWGYFMSPRGHALAVTCASPIAAWELDYNSTGGVDDSTDFGHRIYTGSLLLLTTAPLPARHPEGLSRLGAGETMRRTVRLTPLGDPAELSRVLSDEGIPTVGYSGYTLPLGETAQVKVSARGSYKVETRSPSGKRLFGERFLLEEHGEYTSRVTTESGMIAEAKLYCRHDYLWYLRAARKNAVMIPQKATTHTESWYGWFSAFLAAKHDPDPELDRLARASFDEVAPLMFDFERGVPTIIPSRVQNLALFISLLVDLYEADPLANREMLDAASRFADELMRRQTTDGAYRRNMTHYTAVIYVAKSMLELALCEKKLAETEPIYRPRYEKHWYSAKRAVDNLSELRERIETEGEATLEDGMISCAALQLGFFALQLPEAERAPYIASAEYLMELHRCLEQRAVPDARMRGATLRFWEAQYDVMIRGNMMNSPHGWTSWKNYATYYLYLLTGKERYLADTVDTLGACLACMGEDEVLRWGFVVDPCIRARVLVPDTDQPIRDGYASASHLKTPAYRGKFEERTFGECYMDMISGWYRMGKERISGGYLTCPRIYDDRVERCDPQGGACDNDVHEHFKCLEETLLGKAFLVVDGESGEIRTYGCRAERGEGDSVTVTLIERTAYLHVNAPAPLTLRIGDREYRTEKKLEMLTI